MTKKFAWMDNILEGADRVKTEEAAAKAKFEEERAFYLAQADGWWEALKADIRAAMEHFNEKRDSNNQLHVAVMTDWILLDSNRGDVMKLTFHKDARAIVRELVYQRQDQVPSQFNVASGYGAEGRTLGLATITLPPETVVGDQVTEALVGEFFEQVA
jgi:hypothetical protein